MPIMLPNTARHPVRKTPNWNIEMLTELVFSASVFSCAKLIIVMPENARIMAKISKQVILSPRQKNASRADMNTPVLLTMK